MLVLCCWSGRPAPLPEEPEIIVNPLPLAFAPSGHIVVLPGSGLGALLDPPVLVDPVPGSALVELVFVAPGPGVAFSVVAALDELPQPFVAPRNVAAVRGVDGGWAVRLVVDRDPRAVFAS